jgi:uncharacterized protein YybS (DUF2232 family)
VKAFVDWVLAQRQRLIIVAVVAAPLLPFVTAGLLALETAKRGMVQGLVSAAIGVGALLVLAAAVRGDLTMFATMGVVSFGAGVVVGELMRRAGNFAFAFQAVVLVCFLTVLAVLLLGPGTDVLFAPAIRELVAFLRATGATEQEVATFVGGAGSALLAPAVFLALVCPLLLGYWWLVLASGQRRFGAEFRSLALGRMLGAGATLAVAVGLVFDNELVQNFRFLALFSFLFQGLAVIHAWAHAKRWHVGIVAAVYVLLLTPLTVVVSLVGLVDNWFNLRAPLRAQT